MFLTDSDLQSLTGYKRPAEQRRWLASHGWAFEVRADGKNRVLVEEAQSKMLTRQTDAKTGAKKPGRSAEPDLAALRALSWIHDTLWAATANTTSTCRSASTTAARRTTLRRPDGQ